MTVSQDLLESVLQTRFGIQEFRPKQIEVITCILNRQHTLALLPTGYGKSLCYQVPSQVLPGITLVVSPLIALMQDQVSGLIRKGIVNATVLSSHVSPEDQNLRLAGIKAGAYKLVYVAPERFESTRFRSLLESVNISLLVIDEAHCISQWGHDFRPHYRGLSAHLRRLPDSVILAVTATATPPVQQDIANTLAPGAMHIVHASFDRPNLHFDVKSTTDSAAKDRFLTRAITSQSDPVIIYTSSRKETERLAQKLKLDGIKAGFYHAGMTQEQRTRTQKNFEHDKIGVIVSTVAFGMGVDKPNIRHVIHYNLPGSLEAYYQEAGRAGRDGKPATCTLLFQAKDVNTQRWLMDKNFPTDAQVHAIYRSIAAAGEEGLRTVELLNTMKIPDAALNSSLDLLKQLALVEQDGSGFFHAADKSTPARLFKIEMDYLNQRRLRDAARLERIIRYGQDKQCRRKQILNYFGQELETSCAGCDVCHPDVNLSTYFSFENSGTAKGSLVVSASERVKPRLELPDLNALEQHAGNKDNNAQDEPSLTSANINSFPNGTTLRIGSDWRSGGDSTSSADLMILALAEELRGSLGRTVTAATLIGSQSKRVTERGLHESKYWGTLKSNSEDAVLARIDDLIDEGYLKISKGLYPKISLTDFGKRHIERLI